MARLEIDEDLEDIFPSFRQRLDEDLAALKIAVDGGDTEALKKLAHKVKGSAGGYGLSFISDQARQIEDLLEQGDGDQIKKCLQRMNIFLSELEIVFVPMEI